MSAANLQLARLAMAGLSARDRLELMRELSGQKTEVRAARILRRAQVAERFNVTPRAIDIWSKKGLLKRRVLPGHTRAAGFLESDVELLMQGRTTGEGEVRS
jgi:hypothetical protein